MPSIGVPNWGDVFLIFFFLFPQLMKSPKEMEYFKVQDMLDKVTDTIHKKVHTKLDDIFASALQKYLQVYCFHYVLLNQVTEEFLNVQIICLGDNDEGIFVELNLRKSK